MKTIKLLFLLLALTITGVAQQTSWPVINYGTTANDHTGDNLRAATIKEVQTFDILRARIGPLRGTKYLDLQLAIEYFVINYMYHTNMFYVSRVVAGAYTMGSYVYIVEISKAAAYGTSGTVIMKYNVNSGTIKTGKEFIMIAESNSSGHYGSMGINWDLLQTGTTYTCSNWNEGGLYVINTIIYSAPGGGDPGGGAVGIVVTDDGSIDGSQGLYLGQATKNTTQTITTSEGVLRGFRIKNCSPTYDIFLRGQDNATIEGVTTITLAPRGWADILFDAENSNLIVTGGDFIIPQ